MSYLQQFFTECSQVVGGFSAKSVLVAGCGRGLDCIPFVEADASSVTGVDVTDEIGAAYSHPLVRYHRGSIEGCSLETAQFDVAFSVATMEHVGNIESAYREMIRLVRPGGTVYVLAAPLWNSRRGHHLDCLHSFPWIHLRYTPAKLAQFGDELGIMHNGKPLRDAVDWLFTSNYFNRAPCRRYREACTDLSVARVVRNEFWMDGEDDLTDEILGELNRYPREELLATAHTLIVVK